jgi:hypothetical protein
MHKKYSRLTEIHRQQVQFQKLFEMYKSEMHCQLLLVVVNENVWEEHEFDNLEPLCHTTNAA